MYKYLFPVVAGLAFIGLILWGGCDDNGTNPLPPTPQPTLSVTPDSLDFGETLNTLSIVITNTGDGTLEWSVSTKPTWCAVAPNSGETTTETDTATVTVDRNVLPVGSSSGNVVITSTDGDTATVALAALSRIVEGEWQTPPGQTARLFLYVSQAKSGFSVDSAHVDVYIPSDPPDCFAKVVDLGMLDSLSAVNDTLFEWNGTVVDTLQSLRGWFTSATTMKGDLRAVIVGCNVDTLISWHANAPASR